MKMHDCTVVLPIKKITRYLTAQYISSCVKYFFPNKKVVYIGFF